ncbi:PTS sugar transporter subunit IID [Thioclava sp. SK-1]|uniref:NAD(P)/FAD-dependent oxidoreductase n=1 Tax=Thioclava sp. SK-1 TaxID=1889770 RepID=UPI000824570D|nr:FAD-dependent oxidoreductase [Thioclava sp. SK-1]OCX64626.1 PTS sugar transporter subunit IID [Thioclava sp. SK-1]
MNSSPRHRAQLPEQTDVVVIGGGIAGIMSAYFLARAGRRVVLCEKGRIAGEQSGRNWGWIRQQGRDPAELPIMMEALRLWHGLAKELGPELGFKTCGVTYLANTPEKMEGNARWVSLAQQFGLDSQLLTSAQVQAMAPNSAGWLGGVTTPSDARAEPFLAVPMLSDLAVAAGVVIRERCAVRTLERRNGAVCGVVTEAGTIDCEQVLLTGGAWSSLFARNEGVIFPQLAVRASVARTQALPLLGETSGADREFAFRRRADGGYTLAPGTQHDFWVGPDAFRHFTAFLPQLLRDFSQTSLQPMAPAGFPDAWRTPRSWTGEDATPFEAMRVLDPKPNALLLDKTRSAFSRAFPHLGPIRLQDSWAGMIDVMPDTVPVLDETSVPGFWVATGLSGHGFGIGPGIGRVMADLMLGRPAGHDLSRFRLSRFTDSSKIDLGPKF